MARSFEEMLEEQYPYSISRRDAFAPVEQGAALERRIEVKLVEVLANGFVRKMSHGLGQPTDRSIHLQALVDVPRWEPSLHPPEQPQLTVRVVASVAKE